MLLAAKVKRHVTPAYPAVYIEHVSSPYVPPTSKRDNPTFRDASARREAGDTFGEQLGTSTDGTIGYHSVRPDYPDAVMSLIRAHAAAPGPAADVGAGTGKLTRSLLDDGYRVTAVDPSSAMIEALAKTCPQARAVLGTAESLPMFEDSSLALITCAQTWHWVDTARATAEFRRVLAPGGVVVLTWNTLDVRVPWIHRLTRIMHAGDVQKPGFIPEFGPQLRLIDECRTTWDQHLTPEQIILLARTRSYWLKAKAPTREKVEANLRWYLYEHLGFTPGEPVALTYRSDSFVLG